MLELVLFAAVAASQVAHPVFGPEYGPGDVESLTKSVGDALAMSPEELYAMVPECSGIYYCGCPHCDGGAQEHAMVWSLGMGDRVKCQYCGMEFPNDQYPNNREKVIIAPSGATQVYRWYEAENGRQYFYEARAWYERWGWTRSRALQLANLYALTGDDTFGDRAAVLVGRYAQVYPDYAIRFDYPFRPVRFWPADQKWPYEGMTPFRGAKFYWWAYGDIPVNLARAYDLLAPGDSFERMKDLLGEGIRERIESDLIRLGYEFTAANPDDLGNMSPGLYADMVVAGRIIGAPEMIHEAVNRFRALAQQQFFFDGWWREAAPSYHAQTVGGLDRVAGVARGYSDPPDWPAPRFDDLDLLAEVPLLAKARRVLDETALPDGRFMPLNDTWWTNKTDAPDQSVCRLYPGMGHAILGAGSGDLQFQAHINWGGAHGHTHMDSASILLFAHGKELLSDIGYTHTRYRNWTVNSASHNMVVIDQKSQLLTSSTIGNLLFFDDSDPHVHAVDVDAQPAYGNCATYRRRLAHVHLDEGKDYLVDWFDVQGGECHDYFLHGSADEEGTLETSVDLDRAVDTLVPDWGGTEDHTGEDCYDITGKKHHHYMFLWDIRSADADHPWTATWRYEGAGLRSHLFPEAGSVLHRFRAPAVRQAKDDDAKLKDYLMNGIMQRHAGPDSRFIAVHEPFGDAPWLDSVSLDGGTLTVRHGDAEESIAWTDAGLEVTSSGGWRYSSGREVSGTVTGVDRHGRFALVSDTVTPDVRYLRLDFGGKRQMVYPVDHAEGNAFVLADDPGFSVDGDTATFLFHPHETFVGPITWTAWTKE
ncbi:MAG TPA: heparinase II/III family protein [Candidatus Hydrogenedentes bacterium]|nr:heparinase II/III family protein [Candidatus Hydrogenedentota bacterium]HPG66566.1 heparinase II/III family protein [Candidatus Hydrogenedentota bacterium]